ncbi:phosphate ABC transporter substrate-binding protein PstS [Massilia terrae]|uniref:Phosphate-binding protein PstS n=1 Tax=Massilia terrae TaxID=1811224 RepID=A0ABT2D2K5_9BURK|nr:phosphate ABC transporter substrate-binding protein PstS [Massilia terrae]MCS0659573.1 phosphate ABC transporter substrate-binding protein PstS [Massilia terrae]
MNMKLIMKSMVVGVAAAVAMSSAMAADMTGAGSTFAFPIYSKWADSYKAKTGNGLNYQSIGSGAGIKQIKAKTVDFGASDMPLSAEELNADGLMQFPTIMGGVVAVVNVEGVQPGQLKLSGDVLADIYLGKITKWDDKAIAALNPGVKLPADDITVVHRADGSGTSFLFTDFLSKTNAEWKSKIGSGTAVKWATGVGGKGNEGVAANVQRIKGSIGYVEWAYSKKNHMTHTQLKNHDGQYLQPSDDAFKAAAANAAWDKTPGFSVVLTDQPGKAAWPITGVTFALMHKTQADAAKGKEVLSFFEWAFKNGAGAAEQLDYVPMPASVVKMIEGAWKAQIKDASGKAVL